MGEDKEGKEGAVIKGILGEIWDLEGVGWGGFYQCEIGRERQDKSEGMVFLVYTL